MDATAPLAAPPCWFEASVPVLQRYLERLAGLLATAEQHVRHVRHAVAPMGGPGDAEGRDAVEAALAALLAARLAPDMLPLERQVVIAANFALRIAFPLAGQPLPDYPVHPPTGAGLRAHLGEVQALLGTLAPASFDGAGARLIDSVAGDATLRLSAPVFLWQYALPNFHFHLAMAYALLRQHGVPLGKADYDGWHVYARTAPPVRTGD